MNTDRLTDARILGQIENVTLLLLEVDDWTIPHDPMEWKGRSRQHVAAELRELLELLTQRARERGLDTGPAIRRAEQQWEVKHSDWA